jgi:putative ABC transport system permease protein
VHQFLEAANIALQAIWANKLRSFLTVIGNIVSVTSIIAVVSLVRGLDTTVRSAVQSNLGVDSFVVQRGGIAFTPEDQRRFQSRPPVTMDDAIAIRRYSPAVALVMAESDRSASVTYHGLNLENIGVQGVTKEYLSLPTTTIDVGRPITPAEFDSGHLVTIAGWGVADRLFGGLSPLEKVINVNGLAGGSAQIFGMPFRVVGVAAKKGSLFGRSQDEYLVIPLAAFQKMFGARPALQLTVRPRDPSLTTTAMGEATAAVRIQRRLRPAQPDNFGVMSADTILGLYSQITAGVFALLFGVVGLSLVVGGIVIMNIMLMVVTERTREIGLRKSLGARRRDILWQILTESIVLSTSGGVIGTGLGFGAAYLVSTLTPLTAAVEGWSVTLGIGMTAVVGLFFGIYPAMRAAALDPIEALRRE